MTTDVKVLRCSNYNSFATPGAQVNSFDILRSPECFILLLANGLKAQVTARK